MGDITPNDDRSDEDGNPFCPPHAAVTPPSRAAGPYWEELRRAAIASLKADYPCLHSRRVVSWVRDQVHPTPPEMDRVAAMAHTRRQLQYVLRRYLADQVGEGSQAFQELRECHDILLKTARRCARDLRHAADHVSDPELRPLFKERIRLYETVFADLQAYRLELHTQLERLEDEVALLRAERVTIPIE